MYKLYNAPLGGDTFVIRLSDNANIGIGSDTPEYQEYLKWLAEGNTPEPADQGE